MKNFISAVCVFFSLFTALCCAQTYYVNVACGNDAWTGLDPNCDPNNGPKQTIGAALAVARQKDDLIIVADGIYTGVKNTGLATNDCNDVIIQSENGPDFCIIDCQDQRSFIRLVGGYTIDGFTIRNANPTAVICNLYSVPTILNCRFSSNYGSSGGAVKCEQSSRTTITGCSFTANHAEPDAGAIYTGPDSTITITDCNFTSNEAQSYCQYCSSRAGAVLLQRTNAAISRCVFIGNRTDASNSAHGGAICADDFTSLILTDCDFSGNSANMYSSNGYGGAIHLQNSSASVNNCTFIGNSARTSGGAVNTEQSSLNIVDSDFTNSSADNGSGGAVFSGDQGILNMCNCLLTNNTAYNSGALECWNTTATVENCSFTANHVLNNTAAILFDGQASTQMRNCLVAGNSTNTGGTIVIGPMIPIAQIINCTIVDNRAGINFAALQCENQSAATLKNSILWGNEPHQIWLKNPESLSVTYCDVQDWWLGTGNIDEEPFFGDPGFWYDNNTPTQPEDDVWIDGDYHLMSRSGRWDPLTAAWQYDDITSDCIDAGDPDDDIGDEPFPNGDRINMGAYGRTEYASKSPFCFAPVQGDVNGDCKVDFLDLAALTANWLQCNMVPPGDCWD
ncbi:MAG: right-handed parallel beta-helix repeat-containing protein [Planctomycetota bacterium]